MIMRARKSKITAPHRITYRINVFGGLEPNPNENILPLTKAHESYNLYTKSGALRAGRGFVKSQFPSIIPIEHDIPDMLYRISSMWHYTKYEQIESINYEYIIIAETNGRLLMCSLTETCEITILSNYVGTVLRAENHQANDSDELFISTTTGLYKLDGKFLTLIEDAPILSSFCFHYERAFGTTLGVDNKLWFSASMDPTNWNVNPTDGGYINITGEGGKAIKVISFMNYVYVFREYGIMRLSAYTEQSEFSLQKLFVSSGRIYQRTVTLCGDRILFASEDGFYSFDGLSIKKILTRLDSLHIDSKHLSHAAFHNGKYYIAQKVRYSDYGQAFGEDIDDYENDGINTLLEYDIQSGDCLLIRGLDIGSLLTFNISTGSNLLASIKYNDIYIIGMLVDSPVLEDIKLPMKWQTGETDMGYPDKSKKLKNIIVGGSEGNIVLGVVLDGNKYEFHIKERCNNVIAINKHFERMSLYFEGKDAVISLSNPSIVVEYR